MKQIVLILTLFVSAYSFAQCPSPGDVFEADEENGWAQSTQSKSGSLRPGDVYDMQFVAQSGIKYQITAASGVDKRSFSEENIDFQIIGKEVKKIEKNGREIYENEEVILYDSKTSDNKAVFYSDRSQRLILRVSVKGTKDEPQLIQCAVISVELKNIGKLGLN